MQRVELSIIVPVFNEQDILWKMSETLGDHLDRIVGQDRWKYIFVDNGSTDKTPQLINEIKQKYTQSQSLLLDHPNYGDALHAGLIAADTDYAFIINVDFWDDVLLDWCWKCRGRYDLVLGSKRADTTLNKQNKYRQTLSWGLNLVLQFFFGFVGTDTHGQKFIKMEKMRPIFSACQMRRGQYDTEFTLRAMRAGLWLAEVPVPIVEERPQRNLMLKKILWNARDIFRLKRHLNKVPFTGPLRYHRWAREDVINQQCQIY
jgi:glycosyltransferase involved in cell wall biosynthesis